jgi:hypothetical protein
MRFRLPHLVSPRMSVYLLCDSTLLVAQKKIRVARLVPSFSLVSGAQTEEVAPSSRHALPSFVSPPLFCFVPPRVSDTLDRR